jgi:hypothetical protein
LALPLSTTACPRSLTVGSQEISFETGKLAKQADGQSSSLGETMVSRPPRADGGAKERTSSR